MVAGSAPEGAAAVFSIGFKGFAFCKLGGNAQGFLLGFEISRVEYITLVFIVCVLLVHSRSGARLEYLLGSHEPLAASRVGAGCCNLLSAHQFAVPGFQVPAPEGTNAHADKLLHAQSEAGEHLAYLALQPLFQHHTGAAGGEPGNILRLGLAFGNAYALEQLDEHAAVKSLVQRDPVFFFHTTTGVREALAHAAIVCKNQQTFAISIQSTHVIGVAVLDGQQVIHGADGPLGITAANITARLVKQNRDLFLWNGAAAVHFHKIRGHDTQSRRIHGLAVDFYSTFRNKAVCCPAALVSARGKKLIQAHAALGGCGVAILF